MRITYNALKKNSVGRYIWGKTGRWANKTDISKFKKIRSRAAKKREVKFRAFKKTFKKHITVSKNVLFITYCRPYDDRKGIKALARLYRKIGLKKNDHTRFHIGSWLASCLDKTVNCPDKLFVAHTKKDKYRIPREQPMLTRKNFEDKYDNYIDEVKPIMAAIYASDVCPRCGYEVDIDIQNICFQIVRVR